MEDLRIRRKQAGLTQAALAKQAGCDHSYISALEHGVRRPSEKMLAKLKVALEGGTVDTATATPFHDEAERKELHEIWCEKYGYLH